MGICISSDSTPVATAKLILQDGTLQEFPYPVRVSYVLQKNPMCFICNSDEMEFDDVASAVSEDDELQLGQLYFALPLSWLKHPLRAEEMAALAVKANSALMKSGQKYGCRQKSGSPLVFSAVEPQRQKAASGGARRRGKPRKFKAMLSAIPE
ncbi:hypothetical protein SLA2020_133200 [Shorea laevis]